MVGEECVSSQTTLLRAEVPSPSCSLSRYYRRHVLRHGSLSTPQGLHTKFIVVTQTMRGPYNGTGIVTNRFLHNVVAVTAGCVQTGHGIAVTFVARQDGRKMVQSAPRPPRILPRLFNLLQWGGSSQSQREGGGGRCFCTVGSHDEL